MLTPARTMAAAAAVAATFVATAHADAPTRVEVAPWCARTAERLGFHLAFMDGPRRTVASLTCDLHSRACSGATLELGGLDRGERLTSLALNPITSARVEFAGLEFSKVRWGQHVFTVNHAGGFVAFDGVRAECR